MNSKLLLFVFILASFFAHSQSTIQWSPVDSFPGGSRFGMYSFSIGDKAFAGMGLDATTTAQTDWYEYDTTTKVWTAKATFPGSGRWTGASFVIGGLGYIVCGAQHGSPGLLSELWEYNPNNDTWIQKATMPGTARQTCAGFAVGNYGFVATGFVGGGTVVKDMWRYDPDVDAWTQVSDFPGLVRDGATSFSIDSLGYIGIGCAVNGVAFYNDMYSYNPNYDTWTPIANYPGRLLNNTTCIDFAGYGYVISGVHNSQTLGIYNSNSVYQYTPTSNTWAQVLDSFPGLGTGYGVGFTIGGSMYYGSGTSDGTVSSTTAQFWKTSRLKGANTGINTINAANQPTFYPNPFSSDIYVSNAGPQVAFSMKVYDMSGRIVADGLQILDNGRINYDMSNLDAGTYVIESLNTKTNSLNHIQMIKQ